MLLDLGLDEFTFKFDNVLPNVLKCESIIKIIISLKSSAIEMWDMFVTLPRYNFLLMFV